MTFTDVSGKRGNVKRILNSEQAAKKMLKSILRELENKGEQMLATANLTFNDLAKPVKVRMYSDKILCPTNFQ